MKSTYHLLLLKEASEDASPVELSISNQEDVIVQGNADRN